jgi:hypothetical protein
MPRYIRAKTEEVLPEGASFYRSVSGEQSFSCDALTNGTGWWKDHRQFENHGSSIEY